MKFQNIKYAALCVGLTVLTSCQDTLDTHPSASFDEYMVWSTKETAQAFVYGTFEAVVSGVGMVSSSSCVGWEARTPNGVKCSQVNEGIDGYATETGINVNTDQGVNRFGVLRRCNLIIEKASQSNLLEADKKELIAYGHLLRGLVFFDQAKKIGRFVPVTRVFTLADSVACGIPMTATPAESYEYVISDLEMAIKDLPVTAPAGIANKYAAEVILSRACLQAYAYSGDSKYLDKAIIAANDVIAHNSLTTNYAGMFNETDDLNKEILWGYYRLQTNTTIGSYDELVRTFPNIPNADVTGALCPDPLKGKNGADTFTGWSIFFPTQDLVDQYLVIDERSGEAKPWYETSQWTENVVEHDPLSVTEAGQIDTYNNKAGSPRRIPTPQDFMQLATAHPAALRYSTLKDGCDRDLSDLMYSNRDKRFDGTVVHDKSTWIEEYVTLNLGGNLSAGVRSKEDGGWYTTTTGYYWRKNSVAKPEPRVFPSTNVPFHFCLARVGEACLNLAEAYLLKEDVEEAVEALNRTRTVHGGLPESTAETLEEAWADYIRERRVEMACEGQDIYFSYLRWGKYGGYSNHGRAPGDIIYDLDRPVYKIEISRDRKSILINQLTLLNSASRKFYQRRYLFPIPQNFLNTREAYGLDHVQNELW